jgi:hypothetical protein
MGRIEFSQPEEPRPDDVESLTSGILKGAGARDDPFAPREGKALTWRDVHMAV